MCGAPPEVAHSQPMGGRRDRYPVSSIVRYQCDAGYTQRHLPVIRCMSDGQWEEPQVECTEGKLSSDMDLSFAWKPVCLKTTMYKNNSVRDQSLTASMVSLVANVVSLSN